jgi:hypothetical protein
MTADVNTSGGIGGPGRRAGRSNRRKQKEARTGRHGIPATQSESVGIQVGRVGGGMPARRSFEEVKTMPTYVVGPGVAEAMNRAGDTPQGNEKYINDWYSLTPGQKNAYLYSKEANQVYAVPKV